MTHPRSNLLLAQLPDDEFRLLASHLELRALTQGQTLFNAGELPAYVYFPTTAIVSIFCELGNGLSIETTMIGHTSVVGLSNVGSESFYHARVRSAGLAYRMSLVDYLRMKAQCPCFMQAIFTAIFASFRHIHFAVACAKHHPLDQQIIRWILNHLDRSNSATIPVTHAELSELLGFRREVITTALGKLAMQDHISLTRGQLQVHDRSALEQLSCECYWLAKGLKRPLFTSLVMDG